MDINKEMGCKNRIKVLYIYKLIIKICFGKLKNLLEWYFKTLILIQILENNTRIIFSNTMKDFWRLTRDWERFFWCKGTEYLRQGLVHSTDTNNIYTYRHKKVKKPKNERQICNNSVNNKSEQCRIITVSNNSKSHNTSK